MDVKLLRGQGNRILFMECGDKFVDVITALMQVPMGEVLGSISEVSDASDGAIPGSALSRSVAKLHKRAEPFNTESTPHKVTNMEELLAKLMKPQMSFRGHRCTLEDGSAEKLVTVTSNGGNWTSNAAFQLGHSQLHFEVKLTVHSGSNIMFGIAPTNVNVATHPLYQSDAYCLQVNNNGNCMLYGKDGTCAKESGLSQGSTIYMKLTQVDGKPVLQYANESGPYVTAAFKAAIPCGNYCPFASFSAQNQCITVENLSGGVQDEMLKPETQFFVTNSLDILQSSTTLAIELISQNNGDDLKGVHSETIHVTASAFRRLLIGALLGRDDVLDFAFPAASESPSQEADDFVKDDDEHEFELVVPLDLTAN